MRVLLGLVLLLAVTPIALAEPTVEHGLDTDECQQQGFRIIANAGQSVHASFRVNAGGHCAYALATV